MKIFHYHHNNAGLINLVNEQFGTDCLSTMMFIIHFLNVYKHNAKVGEGDVTHY